MRGTCSRRWMRAMIDLSPAHLTIVERILAKHVPECEVRGFGSRATWNATDHSDLDLAVVGDEPLPSRTLASLKEAFEESRLPMRVDVIDWNAITDGFREAIEPDTVVVQDASERVEWPAVALGEVVELTLSSVDKKSKPDEHPVLLCNYTDVYNHDFIRTEMDFMSASATDREIGRCSLVEWDVIITKDSEAYDDIGVPALVREHIPNLLCGCHLAILRAKPEIDGTYLFYALKTREVQQQFHAYANGVMRYGLRKADISLVELPLPPLEEQRAIACVLSALDDKIELNRRMSRTLEEMAWALFKSWFVDFDPVHAKTNGQPSGLPPDLDALFPGAFETSELGEIPAGWEVEALGDVFRITMGQSPPGKIYNQVREGLPFYQGRTDFGFRFPGRRVYCTEPTRFAEKGDSLVSVRAPVGDINMAMEPCCIGHGIAAVRHLSGSRSYTYYSMRSLRNIFERFEAEGIVFGAIGKKDFRSMLWVSPPDRLVAQFDELCLGMDNQIEASEVVTNLLIVKRDTLLPQLISGAVRLDPRSDP